jgi:hypothetical protein
LASWKKYQNPKRFDQEHQNFLFASFSPLTTNQSDRNMLTLPPIVDLFICLEACCQVTSNNVNCNWNFRTVVTSTMTNNRETEFRNIY